MRVLETRKFLFKSLSPSFGLYAVAADSDRAWPRLLSVTSILAVRGGRAARPALPSVHVPSGRRYVQISHAHSVAARVESFSTRRELYLWLSRGGRYPKQNTSVRLPTPCIGMSGRFKTKNVYIYLSVVSSRWMLLHLVRRKYISSIGCCRPWVLKSTLYTSLHKLRVHVWHCIHRYHESQKISPHLSWSWVSLISATHFPHVRWRIPLNSHE